MDRLPPRVFIAVGAIAASVGLVSRDALAQNKPFPQGGGYAHGFVPKTVSASDARTSYDKWKARYVKSDCGGATARVEFGSPMGTSVSEGMGYGMILAAYFGDKSTFDGLWKFVRQNENPRGMMGWKVDCHGFVRGEGGDGSAPDGDTDIGFALVAAVDQWGAEYRKPALDYLATLERIDYVKCPPSGRNIPKRGDWDGGCTASNTSYFMPAFERVFQQFTGDAYWSKAADDAVALWLINRNPKTGLIANEVDPDGKTVNGTGTVDYNGCRIPWRAVVDYLWFGTAGSKDVSDKLTDFAGSVGISKLVDGYNVDGTPTQGAKWPQLNAWVGGWAAGAMSKSQPAVDAFAADLRSIDDDNGAYYGASLRTLYLLTLSGNFWKPGTPPTNHGGVMPAPTAPAVSPKLGASGSGRFGCALAPAHDIQGDAGAATAVGALALALMGRRKRQNRARPFGG